MYILYIYVLYIQYMVHSSSCTYGLAPVAAASTYLHWFKV